MAKYLGLIVLHGLRAVGNAFRMAFVEQMNVSKEATKRAGGGTRGMKRAQENAKSGLSLEEAQQILNVKKLDPEEIKTKFEHLFSVNEKSKGGSFYLQSKVVRAKERLERELENLNSEKQDKPEKKEQAV